MFNLSFYSTHNQTRAERVTTVTEFVTAIRTGANGLADTITCARKAYLTDGKKGTYTPIKNSLPVVAPCLFDGKAKASENITDYYGAFWLDLDGLTPQEAVKNRDLLGKDPYIFTAFLSPSGHGVKALVRTDNTDVKKHARIFEQCVKPYYENLTGCPVDQSGCNANRLCYLSFDPQIVFNPDAKTFTVNLTNKENQPTEKTAFENLTGQTRIYSDDRVETLFKDVLKFKGFSVADGTGRDNILFRGSLSLNTYGVPFDQAEKTFRKVLASFRLPQCWIDEKVKKCLTKAYQKNTDKHGVFDANVKTYSKPVETFYVKKYLTEINGKLKAELKTAKRTLFIAPTGGGKTRFFLQYGRKEADYLDGCDYVLFITPNRLTAKNNKAEADLAGVPCCLAVGGEMDDAEIADARFIIATPDSALHVQNIKTHFGGTVKLVLLDEVHQAVISSAYRSVMDTYVGKLLQSDTRFIAITATPTKQLESEFSTIIKVNVKDKTRYKGKFWTHYDLRFTAQKTAEYLKNGQNRKEIIRLNNTDKQTLLAQYLTELNLTCTVLTAKDKDTPEYLKLAKNGVFDTDVLIITEIAENGLSICDEKHTIAGTFIYEKNEPLDEKRAKQFFARVRGQKQMTVKLFFPPKKKADTPKADYLGAIKWKAQYYQSEIKGTFDETQQTTYPNTITKSSQRLLDKRGDIKTFSMLRAVDTAYLFDYSDTFMERVDAVFETAFELQDDYLEHFDPNLHQKELEKLAQKRKEKTLITDEILQRCQDESYFLNVIKADGETKTRHYTGYENLTVGGALAYLELHGTTRENFKKAKTDTMIKRLDYVKGWNLTHHEAHRLVTEHKNNYKWALMLSRFTACLLDHTAHGYGLNHLGAEFDIRTDLAVARFIETFGAGQRAFSLIELWDAMVKDPNIPHLHYSDKNGGVNDKKLAQLIQTYFVAKNKGNEKSLHKKRGNFWVIERRYDAKQFEKNYRVAKEKVFQKATSPYGWGETSDTVDNTVSVGSQEESNTQNFTYNVQKTGNLPKTVAEPVEFLDPFG